ncbi:DNA photolyase family protein [Nocardia sp. NBC_01503]|uniref:cryptochrome/photolyase family protein n=1 Tax=Nocardia sp. NBC_01503 TaxID=2975997 RepID=UPI002E7C3AF1|nr:deoxyribodipyrimidine photo-lyase [Nocardia sp. NBC_01503]WTL32224.1 DNA photolyase family protein [Nocardia sp. NBC_01503]
MSVAIALFTRDLRVGDNPILAAAARADAVVPLFVLDDRILGRTGLGANRIRFLLAALSELDTELRGLGGRLVLRRGDVAEEVARVAAQVGAERVHIAADVSGYSTLRLRRLRERLGQNRIEVTEHSGSVSVVDPADLRPATGRDHFSIFTPYFRRWVETPLRGAAPRPSALTVPEVDSIDMPARADLCADEGSPRLAVGGETTGRKLLRAWLSGPVAEYEARNDDLGADATSHLAAYLHFGCLSPTELVRRTDLSTPGGHAFARQLAWRDFNNQLLAARPEVATQDYRSRPAPWRTDPQAVKAWCTGRTGYPIIDAAMRQLLAEGWMPGRARLVAASFLSKSLGIDWRIGAAHFTRWLADADVANNQLNWQWAAGTGTDTRPNRTLNPLRQAERYDPEGSYIHRWLPELDDLPGPAAHKPWRSPLLAPDYPPPIIECKGM